MKETKKKKNVTRRKIITLEIIDGEIDAPSSYLPRDYRSIKLERRRVGYSRVPHAHAESFMGVNDYSSRYSVRCVRLLEYSDTACWTVQWIGIDPYQNIEKLYLVLFYFEGFRSVGLKI